MDDAARHFEIYGDAVSADRSHAKPLASKEDSRRMLRAWKDHWWKHGFGTWAVATADDPENVIGFGGLSYRPINGWERVNLRFRFAPEVWGKGYAVELGRAAFRLAFGELGAAAVHALVRPGNVPAIRILETLNMRQTETLNDVPDAAPSLVFSITVDLAETAAS